MAAVLSNPLSWLAATVIPAAIAVLINYLLTLVGEPWSVPLIGCVAATTFTAAVSRRAGYLAWRRGRPAPIHVEDLGR